MTTGETQTIKIEISELDARLFLEFQKNYDTFSTLLQSGIFSIRNGNAVINFDKEGVLREITLHTIGYKKGHPMITVINA